ncbi:MAG: hypothetical protein J2P31_05320 [Blastocatellia bacterium]|nr:hypothetical protein [Blastocatellia bacterium]
MSPRMSRHSENINPAVFVMGSKKSKKRQKEQKSEISLFLPIFALFASLKKKEAQIVSIAFPYEFCHLI